VSGQRSFPVAPHDHLGARQLQLLLTQNAAPPWLGAQVLKRHRRDSILCTSLGSTLGASGNVNIIGQLSNVDSDKSALVAEERESRVLEKTLPRATNGYVSGEATTAVSFVD
jgi:hypothetical protein